MKKLLTAAMVAALAFSAAACSDDDDTVQCFEPKLNVMLKDIIDLGSHAVTQTEEELMANPEQAIEICTNFATKLGDAGDKFKADEYKADALKAEWDNYKKTNTACKLTYGLLGVLNGLSLPDAKKNISDSVKVCSGLVLAGAEEMKASINSANTSYSLWSDALQAAADYTGELAAQQDAKNAEGK